MPIMPTLVVSKEKLDYESSCGSVRSAGCDCHVASVVFNRDCGCAGDCNAVVLDTYNSKYMGSYAY